MNSLCKTDKERAELAQYIADRKEWRERQEERRQEVQEYAARLRRAAGE